MALADLTRSSVESALNEAEQIGRDAFLQKYGFGPARSYVIEWQDGQYDSNAIAGVANGFVAGQKALGSNEFSGGEKTVATRLRQLGFTVVSHSSRNPAWSRDELILALDVYIRFKGNPPGKGSSEIVDLSALLNRLSGVLGESGSDFRNVNGVYMKMMNFRRFDPVYQAQGKSGLTRGNKLEEVVWNEFSADPHRLSQTADAIKANASDSSAMDFDPIDIQEAEEGRILTRAHLVRERSRKLVEAKKTQALQETGRLACEACSFEFGSRYGERGEGFIEVHHAQPLYQLRPGSKTRLADLHLLCANCHRMVHSRQPWLTIAQLRECVNR